HEDGLKPKWASSGDDVETAFRFESDRDGAADPQVFRQQFRGEMACQRLELRQGRRFQHEPLNVGFAAPDLGFRIPDGLDVEGLAHGRNMRPQSSRAKGCLPCTTSVSRSVATWV